jgi:putative redox protein
MATVKVHLKRVNDAYHFEATNQDAVKINIDASPDIGGENKGFRPMQLLLAAVGGCSAIDIVTILKKQRQVVEAFDIEVAGVREEHTGSYSLYTKIHIHFKLKGEIEKGKAERAVQLSVEKYCSVAKTLEPTAKITHEVSVNGK